MPRVRRRVYFSGRVQGVGFRFTCQSLARGFEVAGYVRNLPDGRVELVAEGESRRARRVSELRSGSRWVRTSETSRPSPNRPATIP